MAAHPRFPHRLWFVYILGCTPGFRRASCKRFLKVTMSRIKLLNRRREFQVRQLKLDVAQLLQKGKRAEAESRVEKLWKESSVLSMYVKVGEYSQFVKANLYNIAWQRECPKDIREALESLYFAASHCSDLPELKYLREIMANKYGKDFSTGAHVNKQFLQAFYEKVPPADCKEALIKQICRECNVRYPPQVVLQQPATKVARKPVSQAAAAAVQENSSSVHGQDVSCGSYETQEVTLQRGKQRKQAESHVKLPQGEELEEQWPSDTYARFDKASKLPKMPAGIERDSDVVDATTQSLRQSCMQQPDSQQLHGRVDRSSKLPKMPAGIERDSDVVDATTQSLRQSRMQQLHGRVDRSSKLATASAGTERDPVVDAKNQAIAEEVRQKAYGRVDTGSKLAAGTETDPDVVDATTRSLRQSRMQQQPDTQPLHGRVDRSSKLATASAGVEIEPVVDAKNQAIVEDIRQKAYDGVDKGSKLATVPAGIERDLVVDAINQAIAEEVRQKAYDRVDKGSKLATVPVSIERDPVVDAINQAIAEEVRQKTYDRARPKHSKRSHKREGKTEAQDVEDMRTGLEDSKSVASKAFSRSNGKWKQAKAKDEITVNAHSWLRHSPKVCDHDNAEMEAIRESGLRRSRSRKLQHDDDDDDDDDRTQDEAADGEQTGKKAIVEKKGRRQSRRSNQSVETTQTLGVYYKLDDYHYQQHHGETAITWRSKEENRVSSVQCQPPTEEINEQQSLYEDILRRESRRTRKKNSRYSSKRNSDGVEEESVPGDDRNDAGPVFDFYHVTEAGRTSYQAEFSADVVMKSDYNRRDGGMKHENDYSRDCGEKMKQEESDCNNRRRDCNNRRDGGMKHENDYNRDCGEKMKQEESDCNNRRRDCVTEQQKDDADETYYYYAENAVDGKTSLPPFFMSSKPPQRPPPPIPSSHRTTSLPNQSSPAGVRPPPQRSKTSEPAGRQHPTLPAYEELVARFSALKREISFK